MEILSEYIEKNTVAHLQMKIASLYDRSPLEIPVKVQRGIEDGPTVLLLGGVHGDEVNGVEIIRRINQEIISLKSGNLISLPILNVLGFYQMERFLPDGRDLNRVFPGSIKGSLAAQVAYKFCEEILSKVDYVLDFHTGGRNLNNIDQIRLTGTNVTEFELAKTFAPTFILANSSLTKKTLRSVCNDKNIPYLLFEGGKSKAFSKGVINRAVQGSFRVLTQLGLLEKNPGDLAESHILYESKWLRSPASGILEYHVKNGTKIKKHELLASIHGPLGEFNTDLLSPVDGHVFCVNESPLVYKGDALIHIGF